MGISVQGNRFIITETGATFRARGVHCPGLAYVAIQGWSPTDPTGGQMGMAGGPDWAAIVAWNVNTVRFELNEASWLGYSCMDVSGTVRDPDPGNNYKDKVVELVTAAFAAGLQCVIIDLHWTAPRNAGLTPQDVAPMLQTNFADADHSIDFWLSLYNYHPILRDPRVMYELFNEPFFHAMFNSGVAAVQWEYMMKGTGSGAFTGYEVGGSAPPWYAQVFVPWAIASYQAMITALRTAGCTQVLLVAGVMYAKDMSGWLANRPTDPLNQMAAVWHSYPAFNTVWGTPEYIIPDFYPAVHTDVQAILAAGIPVIVTESGDRNTLGTIGAPFLSNHLTFVDANNLSQIFWAWSTTGEQNHVLLRIGQGDPSGTPSDGYGVTARAWLLAQTDDPDPPPDPPPPGSPPVPNLFGLKRAEALAAITAAGFVPGAITFETSQRNRDQVLAQTPEYVMGGSATAAAGSSIAIVIGQPIRLGRRRRRRWDDDKSSS